MLYQRAIIGCVSVSVDAQPHRWRTGFVKYLTMSLKSCQWEHGDGLNIPAVSQNALSRLQESFLTFGSSSSTAPVVSNSFCTPFLCGFNRGLQTCGSPSVRRLTIQCAVFSEGLSGTSRTGDTRREEPVLSRVTAAALLCCGRRERDRTDLCVCVCVSRSQSVTVNDKVLNRHYSAMMRSSPTSSKHMTTFNICVEN